MANNSPSDLYNRDILLSVVKFLPFQDIIALSGVDKRLLALINAPEFWIGLLRVQFNLAPMGGFTPKENVYLLSSVPNPENMALIIQDGLEHPEHLKTQLKYATRGYESTSCSYVLNDKNYSLEPRHLRFMVSKLKRAFLENKNEEGLLTLQTFMTASLTAIRNEGNFRFHQHFRYIIFFLNNLDESERPQYWDPLHQIIQTIWKEENSANYMSLIMHSADKVMLDSPYFHIILADFIRFFSNESDKHGYYASMIKINERFLKEKKQFYDPTHKGKFELDAYLSSKYYLAVELDFVRQWIETFSDQFTIQEYLSYFQSSTRSLPVLEILWNNPKIKQEWRVSALKTVGQEMLQNSIRKGCFDVFNSLFPLFTQHVPEVHIEEELCVLAAQHTYVAGFQKLTAIVKPSLTRQYRVVERSYAVGHADKSRTRTGTTSRTSTRTGTTSRTSIRTRTGTSPRTTIRT